MSTITTITEADVEAVALAWLDFETALNLPERRATQT